jgi:hypothetical protein
MHPQRRATGLKINKPFNKTCFIWWLRAFSLSLIILQRLTMELEPWSAGPWGADGGQQTRWQNSLFSLDCYIPPVTWAFQHWGGLTFGIPTCCMALWPSDSPESSAWLTHWWSLDVVMDYLDWASGSLAIWPNMILIMSVRVLPDELNTYINELRSAVALPIVGGLHPTYCKPK